MNESIGITSGVPAAYPEAALDRFRDLVLQGGEVDGAVLAANIANARLLATLTVGSTIRGIAALKRPQGSYRAKLETKADVKLGVDAYPYELGYVFLEAALHGRGLSHQLLAEVLAIEEVAGIFATVRVDNAPMRAGLHRAGFVETGRVYAGRDDREISLLVRRGDKTG